MIVGFIGLGRMGGPMVRRIVEAGHDVLGFDLSQEAIERAVASGVQVADSMADLRNADIVCSSLPATEHVEAAYFGPDGLVASLAAGAVCVDLSTISISGSRQCAARCLELGIDFVDAPVSGTSIHADAGTLVVMAGGRTEAIERARPVLDSFASRVERVGDNGAGLELKLITNRLLTTHVVAIAEAIVSIEQTNLSVPQCLELLRSGAVPKLLDYKATPMAERDFTPQFTVDLMRKDLRLAAAELAEVPLAAAAHEVVEATSTLGLGDQDLGALISIVAQRLVGQPSTHGGAEDHTT